MRVDLVVKNPIKQCSLSYNMISVHKGDGSFKNPKHVLVEKKILIFKNALLNEGLNYYIQTYKDLYS